MEGPATHAKGISEAATSNVTDAIQDGPLPKTRRACCVRVRHERDFLLEVLCGEVLKIVERSVSGVSLRLILGICSP